MVQQEPWVTRVVHHNRSSSRKENTLRRIDYGLAMKHSTTMVCPTYLHSMNLGLPMVHSIVMVCVIKRGKPHFTVVKIQSSASLACFLHSSAFSSPFDPCFIEVLGKSSNLQCRSSISNTKLISVTLFELPASIPSSGDFSHHPRHSSFLMVTFGQDHQFRWIFRIKKHFFLARCNLRWFQWFSGISATSDDLFWVPVEIQQLLLKLQPHVSSWFHFSGNTRLWKFIFWPSQSASDSPVIQWP